MTRDDIIRMAGDAGMTGLKEGGVLENFERFAALVAAAEREACAKVCDSEAEDYWEISWASHEEAATQCATAIRARGEQEQPR